MGAVHMHRIELKDVSYAYPNVESKAVRNLNLTVDAGELKLVTGPSGCGKSTLMRLVNGLAPKILGGTLEGEVRVEGFDASTTSVAVLSEHVGTLFQDPEEQFFALNVGDEIAFALKSRGMPAEQIEERVLRAAERMGITHLLGQDIHALSEGQKQKVGLAGILALGPKAFILDEPTANLDPEATASLAELLGELKRSGAAVLIVDHRLYWLKDQVDEVLVMQDGEICRRGPFSMLEDECFRCEFGLRRASIDDPRRRLPRVDVWGWDEPSPTKAAASSERFGAQSMTFAYPGKPPVFSSVNFAVPSGMTALIGDNGTGKTTLARILTGLEKAQGRFALDGAAVGPEGLMPSAGLVLQNADHQLQMRTVREEVEGALRASLEARARLQKLGMFERFKATRITERHRHQINELLTALRLSELAHRHPQSLSGGEKQRLVIACALAKDPAILILDEPTSGLDGANMQSISKLLRQEAAKGRAVFLITHDLELLDACEQVLDMSQLADASRRSIERRASAVPAGAESASSSSEHFSMSDPI